MSLTRRTAVPPDDNPPPIARRTPFTAYARCLDCGTDEGQPCYDSQDRPLASVCEGRTLSSRGSLDREIRNKHRQKKARTGKSDAGPALPRKEPVAARLNACNACQDVELAKCRATAAVPKTLPVYKMTCNNCQCTYETRNHAVASSKDPHCMKKECREAYRENIDRRRINKKATP